MPIIVNGLNRTTMQHRCMLHEWSLLLILNRKTEISENERFFFLFSIKVL
jgi:hypothetical protein